MKSKVSVIVPSLNVVPYIRECMDSVVNQSMRELEILCVDAGSTDGTREVLDEYARKDTRITVLDSDIKSYGRQINIGLNCASGDYVAILETDDWIDQDMYKCLYEYVLQDKVDYVAADFDSFFVLQSGNYYFVRQRLFDNARQDWYGKILNSDEIATLRASDYVLWKGIYRREFIEQNRIRLHESPGAAFQDMGFLQQVKSYATRAIYIDKSFYRYRKGREGASSGELDGLKYYKEEFAWINDELRLPETLTEIHKKYYYYTMSISLITKYEQILLGLNGDWRDQRLSGPYNWFREQVLGALRCGFLDEAMYGQERWKKLRLLLASPEAHAQLIMDMEKEKREPIWGFQKMIKKRPVVIFGCGIRGERFMVFCNQNGIRVNAYCDNNIALQGQEKFGYRIISPIELKNTICEKNEVVVLTMKEGAEGVVRQLIYMGIGEDRIIDRIPSGII